MKINYEIFDEWWEYFLVIIWGIVRPDDKKIMSEKQLKEIDIKNIYQNTVENLFKSKDTDKIKSFKNLIDEKKKEEDDRRKNIELKAHSLIGQTSIAITLLLALISIGSTQFNNTPFFLKMMFWISVLFVLINFITVGLHARNAVVLLKGYAHPDLKDYLDLNKTEVDLIMNKIFINNYNSYLNNVKATYLKFSHWFFKFSFCITLLIAFFLPISILFYNNNNKSDDSKINPSNNIINKNEVNINNDRFLFDEKCRVDSLSEKVDTIR